MEPLKKALAYRFWIIAGLALLLPVAGWSCATRTMSAEFDKRKKSLEKIFKDVEKLKTGPQPNEKWRAQLDLILQNAKQNVQQAWVALYNQQKDLFAWPSAVEGEIKNLKPEEPIPDVTARTYQLRVYPQAFAGLFTKVRRRSAEADTGVVELSDSILTAYQRSWPEAPPTSQEIREAQEDLWVLGMLLEIIERTNAEAKSRFEAPIVAIDELEIADRVGKGKAAGGLGQGQRQFGALGAQQQGGGQGQGAAAAQAPPETAGRYDKNTPEYKRLKFRLVLRMRHMEIPRLLTEMANYPVPIQLSKVSMTGPYPEKTKTQRAAAAAKSDVTNPEVLPVEIVGAFYLFNPPPESVLAQAAAQPQPAQPGNEAPPAAQPAPEAGAAPPSAVPPTDASDEATNAGTASPPTSGSAAGASKTNP